MVIIHLISLSSSSATEPDSALGPSALMSTLAKRIPQRPPRPATCCTRLWTRQRSNCGRSDHPDDARESQHNPMFVCVPPHATLHFELAVNIESVTFGGKLSLTLFDSSQYGICPVSHTLISQDLGSLAPRCSNSLFRKLLCIDARGSLAFHFIEIRRCQPKTSQAVPNGLHDGMYGAISSLPLAPAELLRCPKIG